MTSEGIEKTIQDIVDKLQIDYAPQKVILFGSYAYGDPGSDSDIDLLIIKETSERFIERWASVRHILSDPDRRLALETLVLTPQEVSDRLTAGDQFVAEIMDKGRVLYCMSHV